MSQQPQPAPGHGQQPAPASPPPAPVTAPVTAPAPAPAGGPARGKVLLAVAAVLFVGWIAWLGYTALTKSRAPTVSRAQAAVATVPVRAKLTTGTKSTESLHERAGRPGAKDARVLHGDDNKPAFVVTVVEQLTPAGPAKDAQIGVTNLPACGGYVGEGEYLLLLARDEGATIDGHPAYVLVGPQRSPGGDPADVGSPPVYPWTDKTGDDLRKQVKRLFP